MTSPLSQKTDPSLCPCGSALPMSQCCGLYLNEQTLPPTAEALMRSRFTAFATRHFAYLQNTVSQALAPGFAPTLLEEETQGTSWIDLCILKVSRGSADDSDGEVEFSARYEANGIPGTLHENSRFRKENGKWYYTGGTTLPASNPFSHQAKITTAKKPQEKIPRNAPCPCGSGKKYKKCCGK